MKISNKIDQVIRKQDYWFFLGQSKPWSFPTILIRVSEPKTIGFIFGIEKVVKISNKICQGIRTQDYWFYSWDRSSRECLQQDWSGYQNPERLILFLVQIKLWSFPKILIRVSEPRTIYFYFWDISSSYYFQQYWSGYQNPGLLVFMSGTENIVIFPTRLIRVSGPRNIDFGQSRYRSQLTFWIKDSTHIVETGVKIAAWWRRVRIIRTSSLMWWWMSFIFSPEIW